MKETLTNEAMLAQEMCLYLDMDYYIEQGFQRNLGVSAQAQTKRGWLSWGQSPASLAQAILQSLHDLLALVPGGNDQDRKATVLAAVGAIYDKYVTPAIPTLYRPISPLIRYVVVSLVLPQVLTWIVNQEPTPAPQPQPAPTPEPLPEPKVTVINVPQRPNDELLNEDKNNVLEQ